jgi:hypothetical protein
MMLLLFELVPDDVPGIAAADDYQFGVKINGGGGLMKGQQASLLIRLLDSIYLIVS